MQNSQELNVVDSPPWASFHNFINEAPELDVGREVEDITELNLDLSLGIGSNFRIGRVRPAISRSSSAAIADKGALSMVQRSNFAPVKIHQVGEMDPYPKPSQLPTWPGAHLNPDICRKVEGSPETKNTLAAPYAITGLNEEKMAEIIPSDRDHMRGRATEVTTTRIMKGMQIVYTGGVRGLLYNYTSMHNIIIMCLCHEEFHTPAEFVRHAGGSDVPNPMNCITISSDPVF